MSGPCMCGADDCERCHPGSTRVVKCRRCGALAQLCDTSEWAINSFADDGICDECLADDEAEANGDSDDGLKGADQ